MLFVPEPLLLCFRHLVVPWWGLVCLFKAVNVVLFGPRLKMPVTTQVELLDENKLLLCAAVSLDLQLF